MGAGQLSSKSELRPERETTQATERIEGVA
jgi:hypothetical protein